ncbi:MAG: sulfatase-like hydrolase/transferase, partial [Armatimonadetes bacterium]|nr:sulfatase-like hydrolase/transferase [Armatimonadota bacterium]
PHFTILFYLAVMIFGADRSVAASERPNIIFLLTDDQTIGTLGCYGNKDVITPNLDKLASEGARFTNAVCATPFCSPTRASLLTGLWPHTHGIVQNVAANRKGLDDTAVATEQILFDKGCYTAQMGKWHLGDTADLRCYRGGKNGLVKDEYQAFVRGISKDKWPEPRDGEVRVGDVAMLPEMAEIRMERSSGGVPDIAGGVSRTRDGREAGPGAASVLPRPGDDD